MATAQAILAQDLSVWKYLCVRDSSSPLLFSLLLMTDPGGDMRMEGDATEEREDDSPLHAANTTNTAAPSASDLAAAAAALAAAVGNTVDLTDNVVPNPYQLAAAKATSPGTPRHSTSYQEATRG